MSISDIPYSQTWLTLDELTPLVHRVQFFMKSMLLLSSADFVHTEYTNCVLVLLTVASLQRRKLFGILEKQHFIIKGEIDQKLPVLD